MGEFEGFGRPFESTWITGFRVVAGAVLAMASKRKSSSGTYSIF